MALSCLPVEVACFEIMAWIYVWFSSEARKQDTVPVGMLSYL